MWSIHTEVDKDSQRLVCESAYDLCYENHSGCSFSFWSTFLLQTLKYTVWSNTQTFLAHSDLISPMITAVVYAEHILIAREIL